MQAPPITNVGDRLSSTLFVAALFHGVIILGVTFTNNPVSDSDFFPTLRITLVAESDEEMAPDESDYLAQQSRTGSAELANGDRPTTAAGQDAAETRANPGYDANHEGQPLELAPGADLLLTRNPSNQTVDSQPRPNEIPAETRQISSELVAGPIIPTAALEMDTIATLSENEVRELLASPSTRRSTVALYLNAWRNRIELIGTRNFPPQARAAVTTNPTLEVALDASGNLVDIVIRRSSGNPSLDQAALTILRLAAPFDPLPDEIRIEYDVLRFAYEWDFDEG